jgi:DNA-binding NarL/FixJ family response regulator
MLRLGTDAEGEVMITQHNEVRILIADARQDVREAVAALLEATDEFTVAGQASTPGEAAAQLLALDPDLLLIDPCGMNDLPALRSLAEAPCPMVLLTLNINPECRARALELGVAAVIDKGTSPEELLQTLRRAVPPRNGNTARSLRSA